MKKRTLLIFMLCAAFYLTACSDSKKVTTESASEEVAQSSEETEIQKDDTDLEGKYEMEETTAEEATEDEIVEGIDEDNPPINWGTPDGPEVAAKNYYANTVFELVSLDVLRSSREYVKFSVISKKDGEIVEPNRTMELRYEDGAWNVVNEGY